MLDIQLSPFSVIFLFFISWGSLEAGLEKIRNVWAALCNTAAFKRLIISEQEMEKPSNSFWLPRGFCLSLLLSFFRHTDHHPDMSTAQTSSGCCLLLFTAVIVSEMCAWYFTGHMTARIEILCMSYRNWGELWCWYQQLRSKSAHVPALGWADKRGRHLRTGDNNVRVLLLNDMHPGLENITSNRKTL